MPKAGLRRHQFSISFHNFTNRIHFSLERGKESPLFVIEIFSIFYIFIFYIFVFLQTFLPDRIGLRSKSDAGSHRWQCRYQRIVQNCTCLWEIREMSTLERDLLSALNREKKWCRRQTGKLYFSQQTLNTSVYFCNLYIKNYKYCTSTSLKNRFFFKSRLFSALSCKNAKRCWLGDGVGDVDFV